MMLKCSCCGRTCDADDIPHTEALSDGTEIEAFGCPYCEASWTCLMQCGWAVSIDGELITDRIADTPDALGIEAVRVEFDGEGWVRSEEQR